MVRQRPEMLLPVVVHVRLGALVVAHGIHYLIFIFIRYCIFTVFDVAVR